ncbi:MAG: hypothetical protein KC636_30810 [Myxococcales bacterium]|nr:hypothetical protein [Myxococcales bacterium]
MTHDPSQHPLAEALARLRQAPVIRITVDERLSGDIVRLLVAPLAPGVSRFTDAAGDWARELELEVTSRDYAALLELGPEEQRVVAWPELIEGHVYFVGAFAAEGDFLSPSGFHVDEDARRAMRVDHLPVVRAPAEQVYEALLRQGGERS